MENRLKIFNCEQDKFKEIVAKSKTYSKIMKKIGIDIDKNNSIKYKSQLLRKMNELNLDISHIKPFVYKIDLNKILVENFGKRPPSELKYYLYEEGLKEEKCEKCGKPPEWNGLPLVLHLDHINGNCCDNRLENLRILCPDCHTQTLTFSTGQHSKDKTFIKPSKEELKKDIEELKTPKKLITKYSICYETLRNWIKSYDLYHEYIKENDEPKEKIEYKCSGCNTELTIRNKIGICRYCKSKCPSKEELIIDIEELKTRVAIGAKYGVSDNTIKKWCIIYDIN